jgi:hypothetical protein
MSNYDNKKSGTRNIIDEIIGQNESRESFFNCSGGFLCLEFFLIRPSITSFLAWWLMTPCRKGWEREREIERERECVCVIIYCTRTKHPSLFCMCVCVCVCVCVLKIDFGLRSEMRWDTQDADRPTLSREPSFNSLFVVDVNVKSLSLTKQTVENCRNFEDIWFPICRVTRMRIGVYLQ